MALALISVRKSSVFTVRLQGERSQMLAINPGEYMSNLPTQHSHHIKPHLLEDLPVFHLNDLCSNQKQDTNRHVAVKEQRGLKSKLPDIFFKYDNYHYLFFQLKPSTTVTQTVKQICALIKKIIIVANSQNFFASISRYI